jgi:hypothetical protein
LKIVSVYTFSPLSCYVRQRIGIKIDASATLYVVGKAT